MQRTLSPNERFQCFALDQFHRVEAAIAARFGTELKDSRHVRMPESRGRSGFPEETFASRPGRVLLCGYFDHLQGNEALHDLVKRAVDYAHRAMAQFPWGSILAPYDFEIAEA